jgi:hypothetical protein
VEPNRAYKNNLPNNEITSESDPYPVYPRSPFPGNLNWWLTSDFCTNGTEVEPNTGNEKRKTKTKSGRKMKIKKG